MTMQALSREDHGKLRLRPQAHPWGFARERMLVGLLAPELSDACREFPVAFTLNDDVPQLVALMGLGQRNLYVGAQGEWLSHYVPAMLRVWPFGVARQDNNRLVTIDADSPLLSETEGEPLFSETGEPQPRLQSVLKFLQTCSDHEQPTRRALAAIHDAGLLVPWEFQVKMPDGTRTRLTGLHQVDRAKFESLSDEAFATLRREGGLPVVYAHVFSQGVTAQLERLARLHANAPIAPQGLHSDPEYLSF